MNKSTILFVFGTRPEAIKMSPLILAFLDNDLFNTKICVTGQHKEMLDNVLHFFDIEPDYNLNVMTENQTLYNLTSKIIEKLKDVYEEIDPKYIFVHGDTTTSMSASLAGFYYGAKVCHIEAGLRTNDKLSPFPEEINRSITARIADYHFAPTLSAKKNLIKENIDNKRIFVTGNTVIDALLMSIDKIEKSTIEEINLLDKLIDPRKNLILVTGHRRENFGSGFDNICKALKEISLINSVQIIYPVHLNPNVKNIVEKQLSSVKNIHLIKPQNYESFIWLMNKCKLIITDSGGIQEEAPSLGKPVLVMRDTTERPEAIEAGTVLLTGTNIEKIVSTTKDLLFNKDKYNSMSRLHNPYGDGNSSERIVEHIMALENE